MVLLYATLAVPTGLTLGAVFVAAVGATTGGTEAAAGACGGFVTVATCTGDVTAGAWWIISAAAICATPGSPTC